MILLDTNVVSALMRDPPDPTVAAWTDRQALTELWVSSITVFEVRFGLARMTEGRKQTALTTAFGDMLREEFAGRVAIFDRAAADEAGQLAARRKAGGCTADIRDTLTAGIALARRARVATRNVRHFDHLETGALDPWAA